MATVDWIARALPGDDAEGAPPAAGVARVLLAGPTGAGKSTPLNAMLGAEVAETGAGELGWNRPNRVYHSDRSSPTRTQRDARFPLSASSRSSGDAGLP